MTTFDKREQAYETKFARDEEADFRLRIRRNRLFGLWVADYLHYKDDKATNYANSIIESDFTEPGDEDMLRKAYTDLHKAGLTTISMENLRMALLKCEEQAKKENQ